MKNKLSTLALGTALLLSPYFASAELPSLSYVEVNYTSFEEDDIADLKLKGFQVNASFEVSENVYIPVSYGAVKDDVTVSEDFVSGDFALSSRIETELEFTEILVGVGYRWPNNDNGFFFGELNYYNIDVEITENFSFRETFQGEVTIADSGTFSNGDSADGILAEVGYQHAFDNGFQTNTSLIYRTVRFDNETVDDTSLNVELLYNFTSAFALKAAYDTSDKRVSFGARYNF